MRNLVLLRGAAGVGKSTWIKENNLSQFTISADDVRLLFQSPVHDLDGKEIITQKNDKQVWQFIYEILENRMFRGEFTIIDATHSRTSMINQYKNLCNKYRYRCYVVDFSDISVEEVLKRNASRPEHKIVPEEAIRAMCLRMTEQKIPGWVKVISRDEFDSFIKNYLQVYDLNEYKTIVHIGDIHGCYSGLKNYFDSYPYREDWFYIFVGDYFDRGIENLEVFDFLLEFSEKKNVRLLEGNHEIHLWNWANGWEVRGKSFHHTVEQFLTKYTEQDAKKLARTLYRKIGQFSIYNKNNKIVFVNHGGIPKLPDLFTATTELILGVGKYSEIDQVTQTWNKIKNTNYYQVHGHRNILRSPITNGRVFNLCSPVERGFPLRILHLSDEFSEVEFPVDKFDASLKPFESSLWRSGSEAKDGSLLEQLRGSKFIHETDLNNGISSFNFTRKAFMRKVWNDLTTKARGLFIDTVTGEIVARSYDKFFNLNERSFTKKENLAEVLEFPVSIFEKVNGYLGIVGYSERLDQLLVCSKSTIYGSHAQWFDQMLEKKNLKGVLKAFCKHNKASVIFEVIDPVNDPHIIEYPEEDIILLDVIYNTEEFKKVSYDELIDISILLGVRIKNNIDIIGSIGELYKFLEDNKNCEGEEGFVLEDANGFMIKIKLPYYNLWKWMRSIKDILGRGRQFEEKRLNTETEHRIYYFLKSLDKETLLENDIITLRKMYEDKDNV